MGFIKNKLFIFIILILLQSCSGGRIGNFFESSFKNIEETKIKEDVKNNLKNKVLKMSEKKSKNNKKISDKNIFLQNKVYQPKSYKIIFILKDVDPKDPTEDLRTILRNSDVNFEIEKIERYFDPKNKTIKSN
jgi:hypothetical protein